MKLLVFLLLFSVIGSAFCNEPVPYRLINANHLAAHRVGEEYITVLNGDVHFFYDEIEFLADRAEIFEVQQFVTLRGNVVVIQDTLKITSHEGQYFHQSQHLEARGDVVMTETHDDVLHRRVTSDTATHFRERGEFIVRGNVFAHDVLESLFGQAGYAFFNQTDGYGYMIQRPIVWRAGEDSLSLSAEKIEFFEENDKLVASFNVVTQNSEFKATSNFLIYYGDEDRILYIGDPRFYSENGDGNADLITVFLVENKIREIHLEGNSFINFRSGNEGLKDNWVSSTNMILFYIDDKPVEFIARENVQSFIRQDRNDRRQTMNNNVSGELLTIFFDENSDIESLNINERIQGRYRFRRR